MMKGEKDMVDSTNKHTIVLEKEGYFVDVHYNANTYTITAEMYTSSTPRKIVYVEKFAHPVNFIKKAVEECTKMIDVYDGIMKNRKEKD